MSTGPVTLRRADWARDGHTLQQLRETVFIEEQGVPPAIEWDGRDVDAEHVLAEREPAGGPASAIACGRLMPDGKIGRMAVLADARGTGIGTRVMAVLIDMAMRRGLRAVYLHAQTRAAEFYRRQGFMPEGGAFLEAGLEHVSMRRELDYTDCRVDVVPAQYPQPFADLTLALAHSARRHLDILSPALEPLVFDRSELVSAISALVRRGREARVRILVSDARAITSRGHRLLALARRLPSSVHLRHLPEHPDWRGHCCVVRDRDGVLYAPAEDLQSDGFFRADDRADGARESDAFAELWRHAVVDPGFRSLHL